MALTKIGTDGIKDDAVTSGKIPANAVGSSELADNAVDTNAIQNDAVTADKIADNAINSTSMISGALIGTGQIANSAVVGAKIADGTIGTSKLENGTSSNDGKFLQANNGSAPSFESIPAGTTINNNAPSRIITGSNIANTLEANSNLFWNGTKLQLEKSVNAYMQPAINIYNSYNGGWGAELRFSAKYNHTEEVQSRIRTYGGNNANDASLAFETGAPTEIIRMLPSGGFTFNGDTSTNNALSDYEIGSWTPSLNKAGTTGNADGSANYRVGYYCKIGHLLWISFYWYATNLSFGNGSSAWYIDNLPFNILTQLGSAYQFIPGGYLYQNGHTGVSHQAGYRWQSNSTNGPDTITMYGQGNTSNAGGGAYEFSGSGCLRVS